MKICARHWEMLQRALDDMGLSQFISKSNKEAFEVVKTALSGEKPRFDPLMGANIAIWTNGLEVLGLGLIAPKEDGSECCPVCEVGDDKWIEYAANGQLEIARELKLVGSA